MPRYNYLCEKCEVLHDVHVPLAELDDEIKCPDCGEALKRVVSAPYFAVH